MKKMSHFPHTLLLRGGRLYNNQCGGYEEAKAINRQIYLLNEEG